MRPSTPSPLLAPGLPCVGDAAAPSDARWARLAKVCTFEIFRQGLTNSEDDDLHEMANGAEWSHLMKAVQACGYDDSDFQAFCKDLSVLDSHTFEKAVPAGITPRARAKLEQLVAKLMEVGICSRPSFDIVSTSSTPGYVAGSGTQAKEGDPMPKPAIRRQRLSFKQRVSLPSRKQRVSLTSRGHYDALGVSRSVGEADIHRAYRRKALETHPDKGGENAEFRRVAVAFETLADEARRAAYDDDLRRRGCSDGLEVEDVEAGPGASAIAQQMGKQNRAAARVAHAKLLGSDPLTWARELSALTETSLECLSSVLQESLTPSAVESLHDEKVATSPTPGLNRNGTNWVVHLCWSTLHVRTRSTSLSCALNWNAALVQMRSRAQARMRLHRNNIMLTATEYEAAIEAAPDMYVKFFGRVPIRGGKVIYIPSTQDFNTVIHAIDSIEKKNKSFCCERVLLKVCDREKAEVVKASKEQRALQIRLARAVAQESENRQASCPASPAAAGVADVARPQSSGSTDKPAWNFLDAMGLDDVRAKALAEQLRSLPQSQWSSWLQSAPGKQDQHRSEQRQMALSEPVSATTLQAQQVLAPRKCKRVASGSRGKTIRNYVECQICKAWRPASDSDAERYSGNAEFRCSFLNFRCKTVRRL